MAETVEGPNAAARVALRAFIEETGLTDAVVARKHLHVTPAALSLWLSGATNPSETNKRAISVWTTRRHPKTGKTISVAVPESLWDADEDRARLASVVPFQPTGTK